SGSRCDKPGHNGWQPCLMPRAARPGATPSQIRPKNRITCEIDASCDSDIRIRRSKLHNAAKSHANPPRLSRTLPPEPHQQHTHQHPGGTRPGTRQQHLTPGKLSTILTSPGASQLYGLAICRSFSTGTPAVQPGSCTDCRGHHEICARVSFPD